MNKLDEAQRKQEANTRESELAELEAFQKVQNPFRSTAHVGLHVCVDVCVRFPADCLGVGARARVRWPGTRMGLGLPHACVAGALGGGGMTGVVAFRARV